MKNPVIAALMLLASSTSFGATETSMDYFCTFQSKNKTANEFDFNGKVALSDNAFTSSPTKAGAGLIAIYGHEFRIFLQRDFDDLKRKQIVVKTKDGFKHGITYFPGHNIVDGPTFYSHTLDGLKAGATLDFDQVVPTKWRKRKYRGTLACEFTLNF